MKTIGKEDDQVIKEDPMQTHYFDLGVSKDKKYFVLSNGQGTVEVSDRQKGEWKTLTKGREGVRVFVDHVRVSIN
jgi:protease II